MKNLFVLATALVFSFAVMAETKTQTTTATKADTEKTCADWKEEGKCPRATENTRCSELQAAGKCPKANAEAKVKERKPCSNAAAGKSCGGCANKRRSTPETQTQEHSQQQQATQQPRGDRRSR
jgi:hypothetical protein